MALQATAPSGSVYRLRNAFFQVTDVRSGQTVQFLSSEDGLPTDQELTTLLSSGDYTVTLLPGWQLERVSGGGGGSGGFGGGMGFGGTFTGGSGPIPVGGEGGAVDEGGGVGGKLGGPRKPAPPAEGGFGGEDSGSGGAGPGEPGGAPPSQGGAPSGGGFPGGTGGFAGTGVGGSPGGGVFVEAQLVSTAVQFFGIFGGQDSFVHYQFKVGGDVIDFTRGRLHIGIGVDDSEACVPPTDVTMPERILLESNVDATAGLSLRDVFKALASNSGNSADPDALFNQLFDSFASAELGQLPDAIHCGDETTDGQPSLNGYPITCDRNELIHVGDMDSFLATAFVNRLDMAPANGAHCGQQRMIFASNSFNRALVIVEAQIPNPAPELGIEGCLPLAKFWLEQNSIPDAAARGQRLASAFLFGAPELTPFGFGPFYTAENLTVGSGQIRTNTFDSDPWTLREFKLALAGDSVTAVPFPVAEAPHGALWNENVPLPQGEACRENFLSAMDGLLTDNLEMMTFIVDGPCKDAESRNDFSQDYASQLSDGFRARLEERLGGTGLSAEDIANRAQFAGSCIGCHMEAGGRFLGNGVFAPFQFDFPQVTEFPGQCSGGETGSCFPVSDALRSEFLPTRMLVMSGLLGFPVVPNPCGGGGGGGFGGSMGTAGSGPIPVAGTSPGSGGGTGPVMPEPPVVGSTEPAPVVIIELASADEPIEVLQEEDAEIRDQYGEVTLSGRSAKATH